MKIKLIDVCTPKQWKTIPTSDLLDEGYPVYGANGIIGYYSEFNHEDSVIAVTCRGATCGAINITMPKSYVTGNAMCLDNVRSDIEIEYLYYCLRYYDFNNVISGSAQPQITRQGMEKIVISVCRHDKQVEIINKLRCVEKIIQMRNKQLEYMDELVKARFVEMFGNPLDKNIANKYFIDCVEFNPKKSEVKDMMDEIVSFVPMECVGVDGSFTIHNDGVIRDYYKGYTFFRNDDVLLAKITPCFENGKIAIASNCTNGIGFGTTEFHVSRPIKGISNPYWIKYVLKNDNVHNLGKANMTGSAGQKRIQTVFFEKLKIYLPPIELQNQFADFVQQVDKSKSAIKKSLEETQILFDSLMQKYFG